MDLTDREQRIVDHLIDVTKGKLMAAKAYEARGGDDTMLALMNTCSAGGICIAIAVLTDSTPVQVEGQLAAEIAWS